MAVMTKAANKPFYVVAESFKFLRLYPLNQEDVPNSFKVISLESADNFDKMIWALLVVYFMGQTCFLFVCLFVCFVFFFCSLPSSCLV